MRAGARVHTKHLANMICYHLTRSTRDDGKREGRQDLLKKEEKISTRNFYQREVRVLCQRVDEGGVDVQRCPTKQDGYGHCDTSKKHCWQQLEQ